MSGKKKKATPVGVDGDIEALRKANDALMGSSSRRMLEANLRFLYDRLIWHPAPEVIAKFYPERLPQKAES